jgi:hypothetical protein
MPAALLLAVFSIEGIWKWAEKANLPAGGKKYKKAILGVLIALLAASGIWSVKQYFVDWGGSKDVHGAFNQSYMNMAIYLNGLPNGTPKYVVDNGPGIRMEDGLQTSAEVVKLFTYQKAANVLYLDPDFNANDLRTSSQVVLMSFDEGIIGRIKEAFPESQVSRVDPQPGFGTDFVAIWIK